MATTELKRFTIRPECWDEFLDIWRDIVKLRLRHRDRPDEAAEQGTNRWRRGRPGQVCGADFPVQPVTQEQQVELTQQFGPLDYGPTKALNLMQTRLKESALSDISNVDVSGKVAARTHKPS